MPHNQATDVTDYYWDIVYYQAFRTVRRVRDKLCKDREAKKFLTRVMRRLKKASHYV